MQSNDFHHSTDLGNAKRLVQYHGDKLRFVKGWGWLVWNGKYWEVSDKRAERAAKDIPARIYLECAELPEGSDRTTLAKWAFVSESAARIAATLTLAKSEIEVSAQVSDLDQNPWLLNLENGTLDLKTGRLLPHSPDNLITKFAGVSYDQEATCPHWLKFLDEIMLGKAHLVAFLQRVVGYSLTADTSEQKFWMFYGTGSNGKSTFLEVIAALLGSYGKATDFSTFLKKKDSDSPRNDLAGLVGARLVSAKESERGQQLAESLIKSLTGGDTVAARFLFKEYFEFKPTFKIILSTNFKPQIRGADTGMWRRVLLVPFELAVLGDKVDRNLPEKLKAELPGILNWAIEGCLDWQRGGLKPPKEVLAATEAYRAEQDALSDFINAECVLGKAHKQQLKELHAAYKKFCGDTGDEGMGTRAFSEAFRERGHSVEAGAKNQKFVKGIRLKTEDEKNADSFSRNNSENAECTEDVSADEQSALDNFFSSK